MDIIYREIKIDDNESLAKMIRNVFEEHDAPKKGTVYSDPTTDHLYTLFNKTPKAVLWVAEINNKAIGCCGIYPTVGLNNNCVELVKFYIETKARGKGIGKRLLQKSLNSALKFGYEYIYLESIPMYDKAISLYTKEGFEHLKKPLGKSGHTSCNIWMLKNLKG